MVAVAARTVGAAVSLDSASDESPAQPAMTTTSSNRNATKVTGLDRILVVYGIGREIIENENRSQIDIHYTHLESTKGSRWLTM